MGDGTVNKQESGFTLIEVLIAIVILVFGLIAVTNLMVVAGTSNQVANRMTAGVTQASEVMERLKAIEFLTLAGPLAVGATAGNLDSDLPARCDDTVANNCVIPGQYNAHRGMTGIGEITTRWQITRIDVRTLFIRVRSQMNTPLMGAQTRSEFTAFRSCTATVLACP
jgi:prepilin-type N-terminal cleavage/methylation domain-containing protein